jgi:glycolate oxidase FAD binding subunit
VDVRVGTTAEPLWQALVEFPLCDPARLTFKANVLPRATAGSCQQAAALSEGLLLQAHAGNGIVVGHAAGDLTLERAQAMLGALHAWAGAVGGNVVVLHCPASWKASLPIWGLPRGDAWLMRTLKEKLDPRRLFNPGRFVEGI